MVSSPHGTHPESYRACDLLLSAEFMEISGVFVASHYFCSSLAAVANNLIITFSQLSHKLYALKCYPFQQEGYLKDTTDVEQVSNYLALY